MFHDFARIGRVDKCRSRSWAVRRLAAFRDKPMRRSHRASASLRRNEDRLRVRQPGAPSRRGSVASFVDTYYFRNSASTEKQDTTALAAKRSRLQDDLDAIQYLDARSVLDIRPMSTTSNSIWLALRNPV